MRQGPDAIQLDFDRNMSRWEREDRLMALARQERHMSDNKLAQSVQGMADRLGIPFKMTPDLNPADYERGAPLTLGEIRQMPDNTIIWAWGKEHGEEGPRVAGPYRINKESETDCWGLNDGSSAGAEFTHAGPDTPESPCYDDWCGNGEMFLFHATKEEKTDG